MTRKPSVPEPAHGDDGGDPHGEERAEGAAVRPAASADPWLGRLLDGRYRVLERLGEGGMGTVYVAEHLSLHKQVALKLVQEGDGVDVAGAQRFVREAMVTSLIDHPNVISAIDFGTFEDGTSYLAMNLVRGPTLASVLRSEGCLPWVRAADIGAQIADALCAAQTQNIVHRDLKPDNVILQRLHDGTELVKLLDFGIAKHARDSLAPPAMRSTQAVTRVGIVIGTPGYMSPEQTVGKHADHRSDLYALGVLLWECIVGRRLWAHDDVQKLVAAQLNEAPGSVREVSCDLTIPDSFDELVSQLLAINPNHRPQSPTDVRDTLRALVTAVKQGTLHSGSRTHARAAVGTDVDSQAITAVRPRSPRPPAQLDDRLASSMGDARRVGDGVGDGVGDAIADATVAAPEANLLAAPSDMRPSASLEAAHARTAPAFVKHLRLWHIAAVCGVVALALLATRALPFGQAPQPRQQPGEPQEVLAQGVRPLLRSLVDGTGREERVNAAHALLRYVPVEEVPRYARAMAHLQLAETCMQKKEQLTTLAALDDPRTLPVLITLAERKLGGCGPKGRDDCLGCLRPELNALRERLEHKRLRGE